MTRTVKVVDTQTKQLYSMKEYEGGNKVKWYSTADGHYIADDKLKDFDLEVLKNE